MSKPRLDLGKHQAKVFELSIELGHLFVLFAIFIIFIMSLLITISATSHGQSSSHPAA